MQEILVSGHYIQYIFRYRHEMATYQLMSLRDVIKNLRDSLSVN